jgi:hypothetical protein
LRALARHVLPNDHYERWLFCTELDEVRRRVGELGEISISPQAWRDLEKSLGKKLQEITLKTNLATVYPSVLTELEATLQKVRADAADAHLDTERILGQIRLRILSPLDLIHRTVDSIAMEGKPQTPPPELEKLVKGFPISGFRFLRPGDRSEDYRKRLKEIVDSAQKSAMLCKDIIDELGKASTIQPAPDLESLVDSLERLAEANQSVAALVHTPVDAHARWCETVMNREIAYASADNLTDFDASELVSAMAVAMRGKRLEAELQVADSVAKALVGVQRDGSWRLGHPFFSPNGTLGMRPPAADVVWTLTAAIKGHPTIRKADEDLFGFVDWLERTQRRIPKSRLEVPAAKEKEESSPETEEQAAWRKLEPVVRRYVDKTKDRPDVGWPVDRIRLPGSIHLATTAYAVNALLSIRDLVEHRLWELCTKRFTTTTEGLPLREVDPVDLLAPHKARLHTIFAEMARATREGASGATYSVVLHGPPGSSKTAVAEALAREMWRGTRRWERNRMRMIRVTPADFTRLGEDRIDAEAALIFRLLRHVRGVTILFDEIDDLLRRRQGAERPRFMDLVTPAMLNRLQDLRNVCKHQEVCFLFGTNYIENIEPALLRQGRIDRKVPVVYPDVASRAALAAKAFHKAGRPEDVPDEDWRKMVSETSTELATVTQGWPWSSLNRLCRRWAKLVNDSLSTQFSAREGSRTDGGSTARDRLSAPPVLSFSEWFGSEVEGSDGLTDLRSDYEKRLCGPDSGDLCMEYLYYLVSTTVRQTDPVRDKLNSEIAKSSLEKPQLRQFLLENAGRLPHVREAHA